MKICRNRISTLSELPFRDWGRRGIEGEVKLNSIKIWRNVISTVSKLPFMGRGQFCRSVIILLLVVCSFQSKAQADVNVELKLDSSSLLGKCPLTVKFEATFTYPQNVKTIACRWIRSEGAPQQKDSVYEVSGRGTDVVTYEWKVDSPLMGSLYVMLTSVSHAISNTEKFQVTCK